jgi:hypothetical protein
MLESNYTILGIEVPRQMANEDDYQFVSSIGTGASNGMVFTLVLPFAFMVLMSVSMNRVWALYNML